MGAKVNVIVHKCVECICGVILIEEDWGVMHLRVGVQIHGSCSMILCPYDITFLNFPFALLTV